MIWLLVGLHLGSVAVCAVAALFAWRAAWPAGVRRLAADLRERIDAIEIEWRKTKGQLAVDVEQLEELEESIERKRARTATAAARIAGSTPASPAAISDRHELARIARARGFQGV